MADNDWKAFQDYMETLNWSPSLRQRMQHDMSELPLPSDVLPSTPGFDAYEELAKIHEAWERYPLNNKEAITQHWNNFLPKRLGDLTCPRAVETAFYRFVHNLFTHNYIYWFHRPDTLERNTLRMLARRLEPDFLPAAENAIESIVRELVSLLPEAAFTPVAPGSISIPLCDVLDNPKRFPTWLCSRSEEFKHKDERILSMTNSNLIDRLLEANGTNYAAYDPDKHKLTFPTQVPGSPQEVLGKYLEPNSALGELLTSPVAFEIPLDIFKEHGFLFAKSGHGKTQTLRAIFASLIERDCCMILIDGNGPLIKGISEIDAIQDRLLILDGDRAPPLNFFQMRGGSREKQMELFFYLFRAIDASLSEQQTTMISYLVDFVQQIPDGNLETLLQICESKELPHAEHLSKTDKYTQLFFQNQFRSKDEYVNKTKSALARRLYGLIRNRKFMDMFNAKENSFDALAAMQQKKIVIVNTTRNVLGDNGSAIFGRYILAQCLAAAWQRPEGERHLALIICDEAKAYLDEQSQKLLSDARNFGVGLLLATQFADQLKEDVRKEVSVNSSIKIAGPTNHKISGELYKDMRCTPDFIMNMKKRSPPHEAPPHYADWACYVDNMTPRAIKLRVPFFAVEKLPITSPPIITPPPSKDVTPRYRDEAPAPETTPNPAPAFLVGDLIQVTLNDADQFPNGVRVTGTERDYVFVEGTRTGFPRRSCSLFKPKPQSPPPLPKRERFTPP